MPLDAPPQPVHQRARGRAELVLRATGEATRTAHLYQAAPLRWLFPDADPDDPKTGALVNVAGGLAGGDRLEVALRLDPASTFTATTPAAEKIYRSLGAETEIACTLDVMEDAYCEWLPQETIVFDGGRLSRRFDIALASGARLLAAEMLVLGRAARGERLVHGRVFDRWRIRRDGRLLWADALRLHDPVGDAASRFTLGGAGAVATLLIASPDAAALRDIARDQAGGAASLVAPGLLLVRWLGEADEVRAGLSGAIMALRAAAFGHPARLPRLWRT
jgi:urease accessory protein